MRFFFCLSLHKTKYQKPKARVLFFPVRCQYISGTRPAKLHRSYVLGNKFHSVENPPRLGYPRGHPPGFDVPSWPQPRATAAATSPTGCPFGKGGRPPRAPWSLKTGRKPRCGGRPRLGSIFFPPYGGVSVLLYSTSGAASWCSPWPRPNLITRPTHLAAKLTLCS